MTHCLEPKKSRVGLDLVRGPGLENVTASYVDTRAKTEPFGPEEEPTYRNPIRPLLSVFSQCVQSIADDSSERKQGC